MAEAWMRAWLRAKVAWAMGDAVEVVALLRDLPDEPVVPAEAWMVLAEARRRNRDADGALEAAQRAAARAPEHPDVLATLGAALVAVRDPWAAVPVLQRCLALDPTHPDAAVSWGAALCDSGDPQQAEVVLGRHLDVVPDDADAHVNLAYALWLQGRWAEGWPHHAWRWQQEGYAAIHHAPDPALCWRGGALHGPLFLLGEQGFGDQIQFARYVSAAARAARAPVVLAVSEPLHALLKDLDGVAAVVPQMGGMQAFTAHGCVAWTGLMDLPRLLNVPPEGGAWLRWEEQTALPGPGLRLGLCGQGKTTRPERACPPALMEAVVALDGVTAYAVQKDGPVPRGARDLSLRMTDFAATASLLRGLEGLITVDTAVAHLAGVLGVPALLLLPESTDWRWGLEGPRVPWYDSVHAIRASEHGGWDGVVRVLQALHHQGWPRMATKG